MSDIGDAIQPKGPYAAGERIYRIEDQLKSLFIINSGSVKVVKVLIGGNCHTSGFFFSGDLIGLEAVYDEKYRYDAIALEQTSVCELPLDWLYKP
jgi:CRP/FNR family transcriptional regulator